MTKSRNPPLVFFGGKGGVGKTTSAAALAVRKSADGDRVLIVSTDPAHSLGDALAVPLSSTPRRIRRSLHAVELDAPRAFARWLTEHRRPLGEILEHGTWLDREDVDALLELSVPGVDELIGILEIERLASCATDGRRTAGTRRVAPSPLPAPAYDVVVVDTAPTGHTLRLLAAPESVAAVADVLGALQQEHRLIREQLARVGRAEAADRLIAVLAEQAAQISARLRDPNQASFVWVTLPEALSIEETADGVAALERAGIAVREIVINRVLPDDSPCAVCDRRRADERRAVALIRRGVGRSRRVRIVAADTREPRGFKALAALGRDMAARVPAVVGGGKPRRHPPPASSYQPSAVTGDAMALFADAPLLFFGGKGGVGKTTVAAAVAMRLARADRGRRLLLLSTDPAHSLGDVFDASVGDDARPIPGAPPNLFVRELDANAALAGRRLQFQGALDEIAAAIGIGGAGAAIGASELMDLAPPGIDELFGILSVVEARAAYDVIIVDTAPTGHALRLLEMPEAAREWMQVLLRVLLKYRTLVRPGRLAAELVEVSKSIRALIALLRDPAATRFIVVTRAAALPARETERLLRRLRRLHLSAPTIVLNARTLAPRLCTRCRTIAAAEGRELASLQRFCSRRCAIIQTPLSAPPPRGAAALDRWAQTWTTNE